MVFTHIIQCYITDCKYPSVKGVLIKYNFIIFYEINTNALVICVKKYGQKTLSPYVVYFAAIFVGHTNIETLWKNAVENCR